MASGHGITVAFGPGAWPWLVAIGFGHGSIENPLGGGPYVYTGAIAPDEGDDWIVRNNGLTGFKANRSAFAWWAEFFVARRRAYSHCIGIVILLKLIRRNFTSLPRPSKWPLQRQ